MTGRVIHAGLDLLDRQIIDSNGDLVGKVDDLELTDPADGAPRLTALLLGPQAYGHRLGGRLGIWITSAAARLGGTAEPIRVPVELVDEIDVSIKLKVPTKEIDRIERLDLWLRKHLIERIPGAGSASE